MTTKQLDCNRDRGGGREGDKRNEKAVHNSNPNHLKSS